MAKVVALPNGNVDVVRQRPQCSLCMRRSQCLLGTLIEAGSFPSTVTRVIYHAGDNLFEQGEPARKALYVSTGTVKMQLTDANGELQVVGFPGAGAVLGLLPGNNERQSCTAVALDTVAVCEVDRTELLKFVSQTPHKLVALLSRCGVENENQAKHLLLLGQKNAEQRMAAFLLRRAEELRDAGFAANQVELPMSRADLGSYLALAVETVSRLLTRLQDNGLIRVQRHGVCIVDEPGLEAVVSPAHDVGQRGAA